MEPMKWTRRSAVIGLLVLAACGAEEAASTPVTSTGATSLATTAPESTVPASTTPSTSDVTATTQTTTPPMPPSSTSTSTTASMTDESTEEDAVADDVSLAVADLAAFTGSPADQIDVVGREAVTWRDGALGCPLPDRSYTQALVDGYRIELVVGGVTHWYHGANGSPPFRCENPTDPASGGGLGDR